MTVPTSPEAVRTSTPTWREPKLVLGILLVLAAVVAGARILSQSDASAEVWMTTRDLATGTRLQDDHLVRARARLFDAGERYVSATDAKPVGFVLRRPVGRGELLPFAAVSEPGDAADTRVVTLPVDRLHVPLGLAAGQAVDIYVTEDSAAPRLVLAGVTVDDRTEAGGFGGTDRIAVSLIVPTGAVPDVVAAGQAGSIDLVRVPSDAPAATPSPAGP